MCWYDPSKGKWTRKSIHRLVAQAFLIPLRVEQTQVNHKDFNRSNNAVGNLEWVTGLENCKHASANGRRKGKKMPVGWKPHTAKITFEDAVVIREALSKPTKRGEFLVRKLAAKFNLTVSHIYQIKHGKQWANG